jgi:hypothetical protein
MRNIRHHGDYMQETLIPRQDSRRGGILVGLLLSALAGLCLLIFGAIYLASNIRVHTAERANGADVSIDTPAGHLSLRAHDRAGSIAAGIPLYPGARKTTDSNGGDAVIQWSSSNGKEDHGFAVSASETVTGDPLDKVVDFYDRTGATRIELAEGGYKRIVAIRERHDGTHIGVASVGEPASN